MNRRPKLAGVGRWLAPVFAALAVSSCLSIGDTQSHDGNGSNDKDAGLGDTSWPDGCKKCQGACAALDDPAFGCGASSCTACNLPNATATCSSGSCAIESCLGSNQDCDSDPANGCEVDVSSSETNCGACGTACSGGKVCTSGACKCPPTLTSCGGVCVDTYSDNSNCGQCGNKCPAGSCYEGVCTV